MPGTSHGAGEHSVGLLVVDKLFGFRVPLELMFQSDRDVVEVADRVGAERRLDGADGLLAALDTFDEVPAMIRAAGQANFIRTDRRGQQGLRLGV